MEQVNVYKSQAEERTKDQEHERNRMDGETGTSDRIISSTAAFLVSTCPRCLRILAQLDKDVSEASQILRALRGRLGPRILQIDQRTNSIPRRSFRERILPSRLEHSFLLSGRLQRSTVSSFPPHWKRQSLTCSGQCSSPSSRCTQCRTCRCRAEPAQSSHPSSSYWQPRDRLSQLLA